MDNREISKKLLTGTEPIGRRWFNEITRISDEIWNKKN